MIPQLNLVSQTQEHRDEYLEAITRLIDTCQFIGGEEVQKFETAFAQWIGPGFHSSSCGNGTDAITLATLSLGLPPGSEAILPAMTYFGTAEGILNAGLKIKLIDIEPGSWVMNPLLLESAITANTKLIVPVHLYGRMAPMDKIRDIANAKGCFVLEDASQAHGSRWLGNPVGHYSDIATYSLYPGKNLGAFGDAGVILSRSLERIDFCRRLGNHGGLKKYEHGFVGFNSRMDSIQAAVLNIKLKYIDGWNEKRRAVAHFYQEALSGISGLTLPRDCADAVYHQYVVLVENRKSFTQFLEKHSIQTSVHYPQALHQLAAFKNESLGSFPVAARLAGEGVSLPMCPTLTADNLIQIVDTIARYFK